MSDARLVEAARISQSTHTPVLAVLSASRVDQLILLAAHQVLAADAERKPTGGDDDG